MTLLQKPILWICLAAVAIVVIIVMRKAQAKSEWGFKEVVKNPDYWEEASKAREEADSAVRAAQNWSDAKVAGMTRRFILEITSSRDAEGEKHILEELGPRTYPTVLALLRDTNLYSRLVKPTGKALLPEAPFNRACELLGDVPPAEAVEAVAPFLTDPSEEIRKDAALVIAKTGTPDITPRVKRAFADSDEYVRSYALMGLEYASVNKGIATNVARDLFPEVLKLLEENKNVDKAADILFRLDAAKATEFFVSPRIFKADCPILLEVLTVLVQGKVSVNRQRVLELITSLQAGELKYPRDAALGEALHLLGQLKREEDRVLLRAGMSHAEKSVAEGASAGLLCSYGLEKFEEKIEKIEEQSGYGALSESQRLYVAVSMCDAEIRNGGLAQYFVNSSGDTWRDAVVGFEKMGFKERLRILKEATAMFGSQGPATNRNTRQNQLSKLYNKNDKIFDGLDSQYFKSSENFEVFTIRYILDQAENFR